MARRPGQTSLDRLLETKVLRVGYNTDRMPFSYLNGKGELVGLDVELIEYLAADMQARLVLVPYELDTLEQQLADDHFDLAVGGIMASPARVERMSLTTAYLEGHVGFLVRDHDRGDFGSIEAARALTDLRMGFVDPLHERAIRQYLPQATPVRLPSVEAFIADESVRALAHTAEAAFAWTVRYPSYHVAFPLGRDFERPIVFPVQRGQPEFEELLDELIVLAVGSQRVAQLYDYWVLGKSVGERTPRWSVMRNVLGWVK